MAAKGMIGGAAIKDIGELIAGATVSVPLWQALVLLGVVTVFIVSGRFKLGLLVVCGLVLIWGYALNLGYFMELLKGSVGLIAYAGFGLGLVALLLVGYFVQEAHS